MDTARNKTPLVWTPAPDDDSGTVGTLTAKQDSFAIAWAESGNQAAAYRTVYNVHERTAPGTVWAAASRLAALPQVRKRYEEHRQQLTLETIITARELLQLEYDIATADPNEIAYVAKRACRNCYGIDHAYQWKDEAEFFEALAKHIDDGAKGNAPSDEGGYGYTKALQPALDCPHCLGIGWNETVVNDTTRLTGKARKLYKGLDYKNGEWIVLMHDQDKARERIGKLLGAFSEKIKFETPGKAAPDLSKMSEADAARAYVELMAASN